MGYRSEVALVLSKEAVNELRKKVNAVMKNDPKGESQKLFLIKNPEKIVEDDDTGAKLYYWNWVKFYDDYEEVMFINNLMHDLDGDQYKFIRVGEETGDIEEHGSFWDDPFNMYVRTSIDADGL